VQAVAHGCFHFEEGTRRISYSLTGKTVKMVNPGCHLLWMIVRGHASWNDESEFDADQGLADRSRLLFCTSIG
jgi:hypothetical protein